MIWDWESELEWTLNEAERLLQHRREEYEAADQQCDECERILKEREQMQ